MDKPDHAIAAGTRVGPPVAKKQPKDVSAHGDHRVDDYYWLRERKNPDVLAYLEAENAYTKAVLAHTEAFQQTLFEELRGRIKETDQSVPEPLGEYYYYSRTEEGKQYEVHCRTHGLDAPEEILLDENVLAESHAYFAVGGWAVSRDHRLLAYSIDTNGSEAHTLYVKNLETGELFPEAIPNTYYGLEWANDNRTLFYTTLDEAMRPHQIYRHTLGDNHTNDTLVFQEEDDAFFLGVSKTKDHRFITMSLGSNTTTEIHFLDANEPAGEFKVIEPRRQEMEYYVAHHGDVFFILTNDEAKNFKLMEAPVDSPSRDHWREVIPHRNAVKLDDVDVFKDHLVVFEREEGLKRIRITKLSTGDVHYIRFPEPVYTFWAGDNLEFNTNQVRYNYTSLVSPRTVIDYDMDARAAETRKVYEVLGGYESEDYTSERVFATANDGTKVPISLVHRKDVKRNGSAPLFLHGYGSYGASIEPYFVANRLSLLDRGYVFAIAHVRGGGEMGRQWYDRGKLLNKRNTFTDFTACADHLVEKRYTARGRIAAYGGSAGGLLMGAIVNMRPELWGAVIAHVPFVDVLTTMFDESIPLTVIEYEEWGNPNDKKYYEYMMSYSPYDNVAAMDYPNMLVTGGLNDPRVQYWEPAKWVAKLRVHKTDDNLLLLKTKLGEGHSGASGRYDYLKEIAFEFAFIFECLGVK